jgi:hypothetical protein
MSNTIDWGKIHYSSWSPETNLTETASAPSYQNQYSFSFDGVDDFVSIDDADNLSFGNSTTDSPFSISAWVKMTDATQFRVLSKMLTNATAEYALFTSAADQLYFVLYDSNTSNRISRYTSSTLTSYEGQWIHLVATYNGGGTSTGLKIYLNNTRIDNTTSDVGAYTAMHNTTAPFTIGRAFQSNANGKIDEVAIFDVELSSTEVTNIYNSGVPNDLNNIGLTRNPVSWWRMGENATWDGREWNPIADANGNNDGIGTNMAEENRVTDVPT